MRVNFLKRMMVASVIGVSLLGTSELASAQQRGRGRGPQQQPRQEERLQPQWRQQGRVAQQPRLEQQQRQMQAQQQRLIRERQQQQQLALQRQQQQLAVQRQQEQLRLERLRQEQIRLQNARSRAVYATSRNRYRVYRNGGYYQTDQNGISVLQQAVNYGYQEGVRAGQSDRAYGRGFDYQNAAAYRSATYGYSYVDSNEYRYYFREGFRRGYEDGYNSRYQYGSNANGRLSILAAILQQVLNFQAY
jgi:TolA-binding protein